MNARRERMKLILLGALIIIAVIQTGMLWLGGMSGHNFLKQTIKYEPIMPTNIWFVETSNSNTGVPGALAYRLDDTTGNEKREYERLIGELSKLMDRQNEEGNMQKTDGVDWVKLLSMPSVIYEYEFPIDLASITGESQNKWIKEKIDHVIIYSKNKFEKEATLFLVNSEEDFMYELSVVGTFDDIEKIYKVLTADDLKRHIMAYQPSATIDKVRLAGNSFLPTSSKETLLNYEVLTSYNPIDLSREEGYEKLESMINGLFISPLVKERVHQGENVIYTEDMKTLVVYRPEGVIEYLNLAPRQLQTGTSMLKGYNVALEFIERVQVMPKSIADNLYLADVKQKGLDFTYSFNMMYEGYRLQLSEEMQASLGMDALVQVVVRGKDVIEAHFSTLEVVPKEVELKALSTHYLEPIDKMYTLFEKQGIEDFMIDHLELVYLLEGIGEDIDMTWGAVYDHKWYYPLIMRQIPGF